MSGKIVTKPSRPQPTEEQIRKFISAAPDELPVASQPPDPAAPAPTHPAAAAPSYPSVSAPELTAAGDAPRALRKRKEPITVTIDPVILDEFDKMAKLNGLSRAAALGLAMRMWTSAEKKRAQE
jgi:hypothetical protein